jgi:hypothetical protein
MNGSGRRNRAMSGSAGSARSERASTICSTFPSTGLAGAAHLGAREIGAVDLDPDAADVPRIVDAVLRRSARLHGGRREKVPLDPPADRQPLRLFRRLAHGEEPEGALLADDLARVGDPTTRSGGRRTPGRRETRGIGRLVRLRTDWLPRRTTPGA